MTTGKVFTLNGTQVEIPPLSLGLLRNGVIDKLRQHDEFVAGGKIFDAMLVRSEIILMAIRQKQPDYRQEDLETQLDMSNVGDVWLSVLGASGMLPGETPAATATGT